MRFIADNISYVDILYDETMALSIRFAKLIAINHIYHTSVFHTPLTLAPYPLFSAICDNSTGRIQWEHKRFLTHWLKSMVRLHIMPRQSMMQCSRPNSSCQSPTLRLTQQRLFLWLCGVGIATTLFLALGDAGAVYARNTPTRRDRRPDREVRIRYPKSQSSHSTNQATGPTSNGE